MVDEDTPNVERHDYGPREPDTLNEMFAASRIPPGEPGSLWVEQRPCPRCGQVIWWHKDGHDLTLRLPQVHTCMKKEKDESDRG